MVYAPTVYLSEVKVNTYLFFFITNYYLVIELIDALYFVNNVVVYKALLV